jgi:hypothetical protein
VHFEIFQSQKPNYPAEPYKSQKRRVRYAVMLPFAVLVQVAAAQCSAQQLLSAKKNQHEWMQQTMLHF